MCVDLGLVSTARAKKTFVHLKNYNYISSNQTRLQLKYVKG